MSANQSLDQQIDSYSPEQLSRMQAMIETNMGSIRLKFYPDVAPGHVRNFIKLASKGFYDNTVFHRVIKGFMIQGGDPLGNGTGGPGYKIIAEFNNRPHLKGTLSMARSQQPDSAGSQFFICLEKTPHLDGNYTVFGQVIEGQDVVDAIGSVQTSRPGDRPLKDVVMKKVTIETTE